MRSKNFDIILSFLLGSSWAFLIIGSFLVYKLFLFLGFIYAVFFTTSFVFVTLFFMLLLEAIDIHRKKSSEMLKQTKLLQEIRDQLKWYSVKSYLITDPIFYGSTPSLLCEKIKNVLKDNSIDYICYRDKESDNYEQMASSFIDICKKLEIENIFLHSNVLLASRLGADGVHLTSQQSKQIVFAKSMNLKVIISTHSLKEIDRAIEFGADAVTYSPIYDTPNKGRPKGLENLKTIVEQSEINIFALGGITTQDQIDEVEQCGVYGFASIRYFLNK